MKLSKRLLSKAVAIAAICATMELLISCTTRHI